MVKINEKEEALNFLVKNGCGIKFDFKNKDLWIPSGGLWYIEPNLKKEYQTGMKTFPSKTYPGWYGTKFYKKWWLPKKFYVDPKVNIWFNELDNTIRYLKKVKKLLNRLGYKTYMKHNG